MLYLNTKDLAAIGTDWDELIGVVRQSVEVLGRSDFAQPVKPYLRYNDPRNRIIAMPAYLGGPNALAGIKWIASFPQNINRQIPRAHSVTILNEADTGVPLCTINTTLVSGLRTAAVSGLILREYLKGRGDDPVRVGIAGLGPIGLLHLQMAAAVAGDRLTTVNAYDIRPEVAAALPGHPRLAALGDKLRLCASWQEAYADADVFITCTVSDQTYIDQAPRRGSLHLNVSLRDYVPEFIRHADHIVVDDWEEVCRQNTDVENMHLKYGLSREQTTSIVDVVCRNAAAAWGATDVVMFNPMGMAVFDIAIGGLFYAKALRTGQGTLLES